jgi:hypothetical protein
MRRPIPLAALVAFVALALGLAACGDDGMSTEEYRGEARTICQEAERATDAIDQPTRSTPEAIVDYLTRLADANERTLKRFEKLDPPEDLQSPHDAILKANRDGQAVVRKVIADLEGGGDPREVLQSSTKRLRELGESSNAAAEKLGVRECVQ